MATCSNNCTARSSTNPDWWTELKRHVDAGCFTNADLGLNIFGALTGIKNAIEDYASNVSQRGYSVGCLTFRIPGGDSVSNGDLINEILVRSAFNNKIVGFGVSILNFPSSGGASSTDDTISVRLYDFTAGAYISDSIVLSSAEKQGSQTDDGNAIGTNIGVGHEFGVKITYANSDGGAFTMPDIDVFIYAEPAELTYSA